MFDETIGQVDPAGEIISSALDEFAAQQQAAEEQRQAEQLSSRYKDELLSHCRAWLTQAQSYRQEFEGNWNRHQRLADGQYDP